MERAVPQEVGNLISSPSLAWRDSNPHCWLPKSMPQSPGTGEEIAAQSARLPGLVRDPARGGLTLQLHDESPPLRRARPGFQSLLPGSFLCFNLWLSKVKCRNSPGSSLVRPRLRRRDSGDVYAAAQG